MNCGRLPTTERIFTLWTLTGAPDSSTICGLVVTADCGGRTMKAPFVGGGQRSPRLDHPEPELEGSTPAPSPDAATAAMRELLARRLLFASPRWTKSEDSGSGRNRALYPFV